MIRFRAKWIGRALAAGILLYILIFYMASRGEPFKSFVSWSKTSVAFQEKFGVIEDLHLKFLGTYHEKTRGDSGSATFVAVVTGSRSADNVNVEMTLMEGIWIVERVKDSGGGIIVDSLAVRP